jgi:hypothetical protein
VVDNFIFSLDLLIKAVGTSIYFKITFLDVPSPGTSLG